MLSGHLTSLMQVFWCPPSGLLPGQLNVIGTGEEEENQDPTPIVETLLLLL